MGYCGIFSMIISPAGFGGGSGTVIGPGSSTDNAIVRWDGITGTSIQNSLVTISDTGVIQGPDGLGAAPTYSFTSEASGMYLAASSTLGFSFSPYGNLIQMVGAGASSAYIRSASNATQLTIYAGGTGFNSLYLGTYSKLDTVRIYQDWVDLKGADLIWDVDNAAPASSGGDIGFQNSASTLLRPRNIYAGTSMRCVLYAGRDLAAGGENVTFRAGNATAGVTDGGIATLAGGTSVGGTAGEARIQVASTVVGRGVPANYLAQGGSEAFSTTSWRSGNIDTLNLGALGTIGKYIDQFNNTVLFEPSDALMANSTSALFLALSADPVAPNVAGSQSGATIYALMPAGSTQDVNELDGCFFTTAVAGTGTLANAYGSNGQIFGLVDTGDITQFTGYAGVIGCLLGGPTETFTFGGGAAFSGAFFSIAGEAVFGSASGVSITAASIGGDPMEIGAYTGLSVANGGSSVTITTSATGLVIGDMSLFTGTYTHLNINSVGVNSVNYFQGSVGIGTSVPGHKLHVDSGSAVAIRLDGAGNIIAPAANALTLLNGPTGATGDPDEYIIFNRGGNDVAVPGWYV